MTRAGVNKRLKAGKLTIFCFSTIEKTKTLFGKEKTIKDFPSGYIPVSECKAWRKELEERVQRIAARKESEAISPEDEAALDETDGDEVDYSSEFLNYDPHDKGRKRMRYRYPWESPARAEEDDEEEAGHDAK